MTVRVIPGFGAFAAIAGLAAISLVALVAGAPLSIVTRSAEVATAALLVAAAWDYISSARAWLQSSVVMNRELPAAFALGVKRTVRLLIDVTGPGRWSCALHDHTDPTLHTEGLPVTLTLSGGTRTEIGYTVVPTSRGEVAFAPAHVRLRSRLGLLVLRNTLGPDDARRVYPDFTQIARYAWLAGDRRLQEIGVKTYQLRGQGTDFKQLSDYRIGDSVRHIDWRATLRVGKPIVREYQDERDQYMMLMVDCGRRMRADDRLGAIGASHFDQVLNAVMLLTYVALRHGDAVGAMTFGTPAGEERSCPPRKGARALNALMGELYAVQPTLTHSDYLSAAHDLLRRQGKRALVVIITNFRDEDSSELQLALRLLRRRHLVLLASLRERVVRELMEQPLATGEAAIEVASAHLYEQSRRDAFNRLASRDALMVDAEPERLGIELVNRYHAIKRAGLI